MVLTIVADDQRGVLVRVLTVVAALGLDIERVSLVRDPDGERVRIRLAVMTEPAVLEKVVRRVRRLIEVAGVQVCVRSHPARSRRPSG